MLRKAAIVAFLLVLVPGLLAAGQPERKDFQVFLDVSKAVTFYPRFTVFDDVNASVTEGLVTITGCVTMPYKRDDIGKLVAKIDGVKAVRNELKVLPVSPFDDELRYRISRAIYGNPTFWTYASMVNPPIHIIVDGGRVTLTGVVNSEVERVLARSLATGYGEFSVDNRLKTDAEMKDVLERMGKAEGVTP